MGRIGELDLPDRLARYAPAWVTQLVFGLLCTAVAIAGRALIDSVMPSAGPFALGYPALLVATLFARLLAGLIAALGNILFSWYFVLNPGSFHFQHTEDANRVVVVAVTYLSVLAIAELFRMAVRQAAGERDREIAERDLLLEEIDHRVKNNFTLVMGLLDMQRRRAGSGETAEALADARSRVESIARAHRHLYRGASSAANVDMAAYLGGLCAALAEALSLREITLTCDSDHAAIPRDRAVSLGLIVNELVTNAAKHAYADRATGTIQVAFHARTGGGWTLTVRDDGIGMPQPAKGRDGKLGQRLVEAFAAQAGGRLAIDTGSQGTKVTVELPA